MASLYDTVNQNKNLLARGPNGELEEQTPQELQNLSQKAGLAMPPITAVGAGMVGANPDQQKMVGTPQQKQAALSMGQSGQNDLATTLRERQVNSQASAQDQQEAQKAKQLQGLSNTQDRVTDFINTQRQKLETAAQQTPTTSTPGQSGQGIQLAANSSIFTGKDPTWTGNMKNLLQQFQQDPTNMSYVQQINQMLGRGPDTPLQPSEVAGLYQDAVSSIASAGAGVVDQQLTVGDLLSQPSFGYDANSLSQLLGVSPDQISKMTLGGLKQQIGAIQAQEYNKTQGLQQQASSGLLGASEQGLAKQALAESSRTGVRATESDVQNLRNQLQNSDQVMFNGKQVGVDDLLKSDNISGIITQYLQAAPGDPARTQLEQNEPQLVDFINKNQALLQDASAKQQAGVTQFNQLQDSNKQAATVGSQTFSDDIMKSVIPNWGSLTNQVVDPTKVPLLAAAKAMPPAQGAAFVGAVNGIVSQYPQMKQELLGMSQQDIQDLHLEDPNSYANKLLTANQQAVSNLNSVNENDPEAVWTAVLGKSTPGGVDALKQAVANNHEAQVLGLAWADLGPLDSNGDGQLDDPKSLLDTLRNNLTQHTTLHDILGGTAATLPDYSQQYQNAVNSATSIKPGSIDQAIMTKLGPAAASGQITADSINNAGFTEDELQGIVDGNKMSGPGWTPQAKQRVYQVLSDNHDTRATAIVKSLPTIPDPSQQYKALESSTSNKQFTSGDTTVSVSVPSQDREDKIQGMENLLTNRITQLTDQMKQYGGKATQPILQNQLNSLNSQKSDLEHQKQQYQTQRLTAEAAAQKQADTQEQTRIANQPAKQGKIESVVNDIVDKLPGINGISPEAKQQLKNKISQQTQTGLQNTKNVTEDMIRSYGLDKIGDIQKDPIGTLGRLGVNVYSGIGNVKAGAAAVKDTTEGALKGAGQLVGYKNPFQ